MVRRPAQIATVYASQSLMPSPPVGPSGSGVFEFGLGKIHTGPGAWIPGDRGRNLGHESGRNFGVSVETTE
jgi:hypothetical protein